MKRVGGPNSKAAKFSKTLCQRCNNQRSQPFDHSYDQFAQYIVTHEESVLRFRCIDLRHVYGRTWQVGLSNLRRYFVKHVACRLAEYDIGVPETLRDELDGRGIDADLSVICTIQGDIAVIARDMRRAHGASFNVLEMGDVEAVEDSTTGALNDVASRLHYRWLQIAWLYGDQAQVRCGDNLLSGPLIGLPTMWIDNAVPPMTPFWLAGAYFKARTRLDPKWRSRGAERRRP